MRSSGHRSSPSLQLPQPKPATHDVPTPILAEGTAAVARAYTPRSRTVLPFLVPLVVLTAVVAIVWTSLGHRADRRASAARYPVVASGAVKDLLTDGANRWGGGERRLLRALAAFDAPALDELKGTGACTYATSLRTVAPRTDKLAVRDIALEIENVLAAAHRGRFATAEELDATVRALSGAFLVVRVDQQRAPELDRANNAILPGTLAGTAYVIDPATGALRCAGTFHASAPDGDSLSHYAGLDAARTAADAAFAAETDRAITASLRAID